MKKYHDDNARIDKENGIYPQFTWDWYEIGGRYSGQIKMKVDMDNDDYEWKYYAKQRRNGRLFWSYLLNDFEHQTKYPFYREEDYFNSMGFRDGFMYVDGAKMSDITNINDIGCYTFIDANGEAYSREYWNGDNFIANDDFEERLQAQIDKSQDLFLTIIDYHD